MNTAQNKQALRRTLREARQSLSQKQQTVAADQLVSVLNQQQVFPAPERVALYLAQDGEIDLMPYINYCWRHGIEVYLPVLHVFDSTLWFARYEPDSTLTNNRFAIPEPLAGEAIHPWELNWVLVPLVGFDNQGGRLGMGGGFYDRTFADRESWPRCPTMIGVAHECQKVDHIPRESWDIELNGIVSNDRLYVAG